MTHATRRAPGSELGAALVEFALVMLILFSIAMGMVEYGLSYQAQENTLGATRSGVRTGSSLGTDARADYNALTSLRADLASSGMLDQIEMVVIFKSVSTDGKPPPACINLAPKVPQPTTEACNIFNQAQMTNLNRATFNIVDPVLPAKTATGTGCSTTGSATTGSTYSKWCPNTRDDGQSTAEYIGLYVRVRHPYITKFYGTGLSLSQASVMRIEPSGG